MNNDQKPIGTRFDITALSTTVTLDAVKRRGEATFTVTNRAPHLIRGRAEPKALHPLAQSWLKVLDDAERRFPPGGVQSYTVEIVVPPDAPKGDYIFRFDMVDVANTDETRVEGPTVTFSVPAWIHEDKPKFPWWIVALILGLIVLIAIIWGVSRSGGTPVPTALPTTSVFIPTATPPPTFTPIPIVTAVPVINRQFVDFVNGDYVGDLIEVWKVSEDGTEWTLFLVPDTILATGNKWGADEALAILEQNYMEGNLPGYRIGEPIDDLTLRVFLEESGDSNRFINALSRIDISTFANR